MSEFGHTIGTKSKAHSNLVILIGSILVTGLVLFSSCAHYECDPAYIGPKPRDAEMLEYYSYPGQDIKTESTLSREFNFLRPSTSSEQRI